MAIRKIRTTWWVDFRHNHRRFRRKSPENTRKGALAYESLLRRRIASGEPLDEPEPDPLPERVVPFFRDFAQEWFETYVQSNNKASEIARKRVTLKSRLIPYFGRTRLDAISTKQIEQFKSRRLRQGVCNKTANNELTVLSKCLKTASDWHLLDALPKVKMLKVPPGRNNFLEREECGRVLSHMDGVWMEIAFVALRTGLRMGELRALRWEDISWGNRILTVRHSWCDYAKALVAPKSNRERDIPLVRDVYEFLASMRKASGFVFSGRRDTRFYHKQFNRNLKEACVKAGLQPVTCHVLRHTFASHLAMAGAPVAAIQRLLGHSDIQTTMRYAHLSRSTLVESINLLESEAIGENFGQPVGNIWATPGMVSQNTAQ